MTTNLDGESSTLSSVSNIAGGHDIDSSSVADSVYSSDDRLRTVLDSSYCILELLDVLSSQMVEWNQDSIRLLKLRFD